MKIDPKQLAQGNKVILSACEDPKVLDVGAPGITATGPVEINAEAVRIKDTLDIEVDLASNVTVECCRCLAPVQLSIAKNFRLDYPIDKRETTIDISEDIRQELMLAYPLKPLCKPDCKGLCPACGKNLNEGPCECKINKL